jgi:hypothetical protein
MYARRHKDAEIVFIEPDYGPPPKTVKVEYPYARKPGRKPILVTLKVDEAEAERLVKEEDGRILP